MTRSAIELSPADRAVLTQCVQRAGADGHTRWLAYRIDRKVPEPLDCYARVDSRDRFLWQAAFDEVDPGARAARFAVAWGIADEIESAGNDRFSDVRAWHRRVRDGLDWIGSERADETPTFFGGFGFEAESRGSDDWKGFPAARFVLPGSIIEHDGQQSGFVAIARVEPGATPASVEEALASRLASFEALCEPREEAKPDAATSAQLASVWPDGPEYRVRSDRPHEIFRAQVELALEAFERGELEKVVLARSLSVDHDGRLDVPSFLARLRNLYPTCTLIAMGRGEDTFLAATPETLVRVRGDDVATAALAGSAPRGRHPEEDRTLGEALLASDKERNEHGHVVEAIRGVLERECDELEVPIQPGLRKLFGIQHLETSIRGRLTNSADPGQDRDVLRLVERLHPTPAVGGVPDPEARAWLRENEGLDRGWYAAPIGWLDAAQGGDFRVALRSGLIRNPRMPSVESGPDAGRHELAMSRALLFAGAGLVAGSDPDQELAETRIKLRALLAPLTEI